MVAASVDGLIGTASVTVMPAVAPVVVSDLAWAFDGSSRSATVTTDPPGLPVRVTSDGGAVLPIGVGSYLVEAEIDDPNYQGSASGSLIISGLSFNDWQSDQFPPGKGCPPKIPIRMGCAISPSLRWGQTR